MNKLIKFVIRNYVFVIVFMLLILPSISFAVYKLGDPLVPCTDGKACDFNQLMTLVNNVITFILEYMAIPIAAIMFAYAGFLLVTAQGGEAKSKAKNIFSDAVIGLIIAMAAFLFIKLILSTLGFTGASWVGF